MFVDTQLILSSDLMLDQTDYNIYTTKSIRSDPNWTNERTQWIWMGEINYDLRFIEHTTIAKWFVIGVRHALYLCMLLAIKHAKKKN